MSGERWGSPPLDGAVFERARRRVRLAYEVGRARSGSVRGALVASIVTIIALMKFEPSSAPLAVVAFLVIAFAEWRGGAIVGGMRVGSAVASWRSSLPSLSCDLAALHTPDSRPRVTAA